MRDPHPPEGFTELLDLMKSAPEHMPYPVAWDRLALLQWGEFPPEFAADVVKANGSAASQRLRRGDGVASPNEWWSRSRR